MSRNKIIQLANLKKIQNIFSKLPHDRVTAVSFKNQRVLVVFLAWSFQFNQNCVQSCAHITSHRLDFLRTATLQINTSHWRLQCKRDNQFIGIRFSRSAENYLCLFIIRISPVAQYVTMQTTPTTVPSSEPGNIFEHGKESFMMYGHRQLTMNFHEYFAQQWTNKRFL